MKYKILYADPPWQYGDTRGKGYGGAEQHYNTMSIDKICNLPMEELTDDDALLFLWVTFPMLIDAMRVFPAWGFKYKTLGFAWIKTNPRQDLKQHSFLPTDIVDDCFGIGHYTKSNCEICLIGVKGKGVQLIKSNRVKSTIISVREKHSKKPDEARKRITQLVGDIPRIELFAREVPEGWDVWGDEVLEKAGAGR